MGIKDRIKELRQMHNISQQVIADKLGVNQSTIAAYESGRNVPTLDMLVALSKFFGVSTDYLLCVNDGKNTDQEIMIQLEQLSEKEKLIIKKVMTALADEEKKSQQQSQNA